MGITDITLITPPSSAEAITAAMNTNPHLTGFPLPKPDLLAPKDLNLGTGTAEILRLKEVRDIIKDNFVVLPCDLVCELGGGLLLESWMVKQAALGGVTGTDEFSASKYMVPGGQNLGRMGGLGVWYDTKGETVIKGEETDFIATSPLEGNASPSSTFPMLRNISNLVYAVPTDTLKDMTDAKESLPIRHSLLRAHRRVRMLTSHRDAHIYVFPAWVLDWVNNNEYMESIGEDVIGWWAKCGWQKGLGEKLNMDQTFGNSETAITDDENHNSQAPEVDFASMSTTWTSDVETAKSDKSKSMVVPPMLAYIHPFKPDAGPIIRRVDTAPLLLSVSLQLARLKSIEEMEKGEVASPLAHQSKVAYTGGIAQRTTVTRSDCLLAENVIVEEKSAIKECVIGANCTIRTGAKLTRCVLMDGVVVGKGCKLTNCILGRRSEIGENSELTDCEVQENLLVSADSKSLVPKVEFD